MRLSSSLAVSLTRTLWCPTNREELSFLLLLFPLFFLFSFYFLSKKRVKNNDSMTLRQGKRRGDKPHKHAGQKTTRTTRHLNEGAMLLRNPLHDLRSNNAWDSICLEKLHSHSRQAITIDHLTSKDLLDSLGKHNFLACKVLDELFCSQFLKLGTAYPTTSSGNRSNKSKLCGLCLCGLLLFQSTSARCNGRKLRSLLVRCCQTNPAN